MPQADKQGGKLMTLGDRIKKENKQIEIIIRNINKKLTHISARTKHDYTAKLVILFIFSKSAQTYKATQELIKMGYEGDAIILLRCLFENLVSAKFVDQKPHPRAKLFLDFDWIVKYQLMKDLDRDKVTAMKKNTAVGKTTPQEIRMRCRNVTRHRRYHGIKNKRSWSGKSIKMMADETQLADVYKRVYRLTSQYVHGTASSSPAYFGMTKHGHLNIKKPIPKKMTRGLAATSSMANICMLWISDIVNKRFALDLDSDIQAGLEILHLH